MNYFLNRESILIKIRCLLYHLFSFLLLRYTNILRHNGRGGGEGGGVTKEVMLPTNNEPKLLSLEISKPST